MNKTHFGFKHRNEKTPLGMFRSTMYKRPGERLMSKNLPKGHTPNQRQFLSTYTTEGESYFRTTALTSGVVGVSASTQVVAVFCLVDEQFTIEYTSDFVTWLSYSFSASDVGSKTCSRFLTVGDYQFAWTMVDVATGKIYAAAVTLHPTVPASSTNTSTLLATVSSTYPPNPLAAITKSRFVAGYVVDYIVPSIGALYTFAKPNVYTAITGASYTTIAKVSSSKYMGGISLNSEICYVGGEYTTDFVTFTRTLSPNAVIVTYAENSGTVAVSVDTLTNQSSCSTDGINWKLGGNLTVATNNEAVVEMATPNGVFIYGPSFIASSDMLQWWQYDDVNARESAYSGECPIIKFKGDIYHYSKYYLWFRKLSLSAGSNYVPSTYSGTSMVITL